MKHGFGERKKRLVVGKLGAVEGSQDKANVVRASRRLQEVVCTLFFAARIFQISEARRRFSRFLFAINVPRDGGPPLLTQEWASSRPLFGRLGLSLMVLDPRLGELIEFV